MFAPDFYTQRDAHATESCFAKLSIGALLTMFT